MLNYNEFKKLVQETFLNFMPPEFQNMELLISPMARNNTFLDGITLKSDSNSSGPSISPIIYVEDVYEHYIQSGNPQQAITTAASVMTEAFHDKDKILAATNPDNAFNNIVFELVNTKQNSHMLEKIPHREYQDLSIVYRWIISINNDGISSSLVTNSLADRLGLSENDLYSLAFTNTRKMLTPEITVINDVIQEMMYSNEYPPDLFEVDVTKRDPKECMYVITNNIKTRGAASVLYEDKLHELSSTLGTDLYILPSSIHEVIAVSTETADPYELVEMVAEINSTVVSIDERLSNQVYHYDMKERTVSLATPFHDKALVSEKPLSFPEPKKQSINAKLAAKKQEIESANLNTHENFSITHEEQHGI